MKKALFALLLAAVFLAGAACAPRDPVPSTEFHPYIPAHDEPSLEELLSEEPFASLLPAAADRFEMKTSYRRLYDEHSRPYREARLHTSWGAAGSSGGTGSMDVDVYDVGSVEVPSGHLVKSSDLTPESLRPHTIRVGESGLSFHVYVQCAVEEKEYYVYYSGRHDKMTEKDLYDLITSAKVFQN